MTHNTATEEGRLKRLSELVTQHAKNGNERAIIRLIGGARWDLEDYTPADAGEPPMGATWN